MAKRVFLVEIVGQRVECGTAIVVLDDEGVDDVESLACEIAYNVESIESEFDVSDTLNPTDVTDEWTDELEHLKVGRAFDYERD